MGILDLFSLKGAVEDVLAAAQVAGKFEASADPRLHPTRQAAISVAGAVVGIIGQVHPDAAEASSLPSETVLAELDLSALLALPEARGKMKQVGRNPAVRRDVSVLVAKSTPFSTISEAVATAGGTVLEKQWLFDVYEGDQVPPGKRSLALRLLMRSPERTLTEKDIGSVRQRVLSALDKEYGATLRSRE